MPPSVHQLKNIDSSSQGFENSCKINVNFAVIDLKLKKEAKPEGISVRKLRIIRVDSS